MTKHSLAVLAAALSLGGCATIFNSGDHKVVLASQPEGATVVVVNRAGQTVHQGVTPLSLSWKRSAGYFSPEIYNVRFSKAGFDTKELTITSGVSGWYFGNILLGGLIGMLAVDPLTGAMYTFPDRVEHTLTAAAPKTSAHEGTLQVVDFNSLPAEQRARAVLVGAVSLNKVP